MPRCFILVMKLLFQNKDMKSISNLSYFDLLTAFVSVNSVTFLMYTLIVLLSFITYVQFYENLTLDNYI